MAGASTSNTLEGAGEPGEQIDIIELGSFELTGDDRPVVANVVRADDEAPLSNQLGTGEPSAH